MADVTLVGTHNQGLTPEIPIMIDEITVTTDYTYTPTAITGLDIRIISCYATATGAVVKVTNSSGTLTFDNGGSLSAANCILTYTYL